MEATSMPSGTTSAWTGGQPRTFHVKCSQCGLPFVYCLECSTVYPDLPDTTRFDDQHNATDPSRPSHRCRGCGYVFEYAFIRNRRYRVTRAEWLAAGLGALLQAPP